MEVDLQLLQLNYQSVKMKKLPRTEILDSETKGLRSNLKNTVVVVVVECFSERTLMSIVPRPSISNSLVGSRRSLVASLIWILPAEMPRNHKTTKE